MRHSTDLSHLAVKIPLRRESSYDQCRRPEEMRIDSGRAFETYTILHILINLTRAERVLFLCASVAKKKGARRVNCCARRTRGNVSGRNVETAKHSRNPPRSPHFETFQAYYSSFLSFPLCPVQQGRLARQIIGFSRCPPCAVIFQIRIAVCDR